MGYPVSVDWYINQACKIDTKLTLNLYKTCIRKAKHFLLELQHSLQNNKEYCKDENLKTVITFHFIKHFFYSIYEKMNIKEGLIEALKFKHEEKEYTMLELLALCKAFEETKREKGLSASDIKVMLLAKENNDAFVILNLFEYNFNIDEASYDFVDVKNIKSQNANEKKDRLIWNLLYSGQSEYTNFENAINEFINVVLNKPEEEQESAFSIFQVNMFNEKMRKSGNSTIFRLGRGTYFCLIQAFCMVNVCAENWQKFISFYFRQAKVKEINYDLIDALYYCDLQYKTVYLDLLQRFNQLTIIGNMNKQKNYKSFLIKYLRALSRLIYMDTHELWMIEDGEGEIKNIEIICDMLDRMKKKLISLKNSIPISKISIELLTIISFIDKNIEIITNPTDVEFEESPVKVNYNTRFVNQEEYDRLKALPRDEEFLSEIEKSYENDLIGVYEVNKLMTDTVDDNSK